MLSIDDLSRYIFHKRTVGDFSVTDINSSFGHRSTAPALPDGLRWLVLLIAFSASLAGGIYVPTLWAKFLLLAVTTLAGLMMSVDLLTRILSALVDRQRWNFKQRKETGKNNCSI